MTGRLAELAERTEAAAKAANLLCDPRPELASRNFRGGAGEEALQGAHLPLHIRALFIGRYPVLLGLLPDAPDVALVREAVRRYRNQGVVARSYLPTEQALDLQLWLQGPPGSDVDAEWRALALAVERDDRVARKLVWLPPAALEERDAAFTAFIGRSFLARPWKALPPQPAGQLDRLSAVVAVATDLNITPEVLDVWLKLAADDDYEDGPPLVDALIEAWPELEP